MFGVCFVNQHHRWWWFGYFRLFLVLVICSTGGGEKCLMHSAKMRTQTSPSDKLFLNMCKNRTTGFDTSKSIYLDKRSDSNCSVLINFRGETREVFYASNGSMPKDTWYLRPRNNMYYRMVSLKYDSEVNYAPLGVYKVFLKHNESLTLYNIHRRKTHSERGASPPPPPVLTFDGGKKGQNLTLSLNLTDEFRLCLEFHGQFNGSRDSKPKNVLKCGQVVTQTEKSYTNHPDYQFCDHDINSRLYNQLAKCYVDYSSFDGGDRFSSSPSSLSGINVTVFDVNATELEMVLQCSDPYGLYSHNVRIPFVVAKKKVNNYLAQTQSFTAVSVGFVLSVVLVVLAVFSVFYYRRKQVKVKARPRLHSWREMPVSIERQVTQMTTDETSEDEEYEYREEKRRLLMEQEAKIWPQWILEARLMRFPRKDITYDEGKPLGCGFFGVVYNGSVQYGFASFEVAIKQAKNEHKDSQDDLLREAQKLEKLRDHPNVVNIKGITLETAPDGLCRKYSLILTLYTSGNLQGHLQKNRSTLSLSQDEARMTLWGYQIANGMHFLGEKGILHLDLATRNILLTHPHEVAKISDFGLSRFQSEVSSPDFEKEEANVALPINWLPLDVWRYGTLRNATPATDVWSFGVLLWEIFSLGGVPYKVELEESSHLQDYQPPSGTDRQDLLSHYLESGHRLRSPWSKLPQSSVTANASFIYNLMLKCWTIEAKDRPSFAWIRSNLASILADEQLGAKTEQDDKEEQAKYAKLCFANHEYHHEYLKLV